MSHHAVGVCGFGRCGSTMLMTMLVAGGCPPGGATQPPYEGDFQQLWNLPLGGRAVKLLDSVTYYGVPSAPTWRFVWLDRDPVEQARSHIKFVNTFVGQVADHDDAVARFAASYQRDRPKTLNLLHGHGSVLVMRYEHVLADPLRAARNLRKVWPTLDVDAASAVVHDRDGRCRPDLSAEWAAIQGGAP